MADLYGMPGLEDEALNMPGLVPHVSRVGQYYNQLQQQVQQAQQERQARELPPLPAPQEAPPAAPISYVDWPTYQQMRQGADPAQVYTEYTQGVLANQLRSMGATPEQIQQGQELFKQLVPPPALARPTTWGGRFGELGTAVGQEMGAVKRSLLGAQAFVGGNKEEAARLLAEQQQAEEQVPTSQKAFRAGLRPDWYTPSGAAAFVRSAISEPQGFFDSTAQFVANMLGTWVAPEMVGAAAGTAAGPVGTVVGGPLAVGAAQGAMKAGEIGLQKLAQQAVAAGIDPKNSQQVAAWLQAGGADNLFGPLTDVTKGGLTNAAVLTLTLGLAKYAGSVSSKLLGESGMVGQAEATAAAAGVPATRAESATANKLLTQARLAKAGEAAVGAGGFAGAAALSNLAADLPVDEQELFSNAAMFLIPYSFGLKRFVRPGAPEAGKPVTPAKPAEGAPPGEAPKGGGALTEEEINEAAAAALPEKGAVAAPAAAKPEVKPPPAKIENIENIKSFAKDTTPEERAQAVTEALDTAREDPEQQQQIIEALVALHLTRDVKEESANEIVQQVAQAAHENQVKPKRVRKPKPAPAESPLATRAAAAAESPIDAAVAAEVGRGAPAAERTVEPTSNGPLLQGVGGEAEAGPNRAAGVGVNEEGVHPRTPLESGGGKPARGARRNRAATVAEPSVPVGGEGGGEPGRPGANLLLAGREATEAANRKTEADIAEVRRREAEGPVNEARGPTNEHVSSDTIRSTYQTTRKWIEETINAAEERLQRDPTNADAKEMLAEAERRLADLDAKYFPLIERAQKMERGEFIPIIQEQVAAGKIKRGEQPLYEALAHGATRSALEWIAKNSTNPLHKLVAKFLLHANIVPEARFELISSGAMGDYMAATDRIRINPQEYLDNISTPRMVQTLLHEVVHGGTVNALAKAHELLQRIKQQAPLSDADRQYMRTNEFKAAKNLFDVFNWMRRRDPWFEQRFHYGAKDPFEMITEALTNPAFQLYLKRIKLPWDIAGIKISTAWDWFVDKIKTLLGIEGVSNNALSHIMEMSFAVARERNPVQMEKGRTYAPQYNRLPATSEELRGHLGILGEVARARGKEEPAGEPYFAMQQEARQEETRRDALAKSYATKGPGHIIGIDKTGAATHRAWENEDGTYRFYKVTPEEPNGAKDSHVDISEDEVYSRIEAAGAIPENRTLGDYGIAGNNRNQIARWKDGRLVATAIKGDDGTWHFQTSENLAREFRSIYTPQKQDFPTRAEAERAADAVSKHKSFQESEDARIIDQERALSGGEWKVTPGLSSKFRNFLWNKESPMYMLGRAIQAYYERAGRNMPQGMDVLAAWFLRHSYAGRDMERGREQATPLIQKARQIIQDSPYLKHSKDGYDRLNKALSALIINERLPKLLPRYTDEAKWIDGEEAKGETPEYKQAQKNLEEAKAHLVELDRVEPGLKDKLYAMMREWKKYSDETVDIERKFGLKSDLQAKKIKSAYSIYGPIKTEGKVSPGKTATGQTWLGNDILSRIVEQRMDAIARGYDNLATNTMLKWAKVGDILNPDGTKVFKVEPVDREHLQHDPDTGEITVTQRLNENKSIIFWQDGRPMRMELQGKFGEQLLGAMKHLQEAEHTHAIKTALGYAGFYTRMFSALHTSLSPAFALRNFVRDIATNVSQLDKRISYGKLGKAMFSPAVWGAAAKLGYKQAAKTFGKDTVGHYSEQDLAQALAAAKKGQANAEQMGWLVDHYQPLIEHRLRYGNEQITSDWPTALRPSVKSGIKEYLAPADGRITNFISGSTHMLEGVNRIAVFKAGLEAGLTPEQAALAAKNSTTNFELRGSMAPTVNPLYAFANAKMQGMRTLAENLGFSPTHGLGTGGFKQAARGLVGGKIAESANVRTVRAAQLAIALGLGAGYANYTNSEKDKDGRTSYGKRSEYQLDEYLHIPGTNLDLPIPQEIGSFYNIGSSMADQLWGDRAGSASTPMVRFITAMLQNFWPLGTSMHDPIGVHGEGGDYVARLAMPTQIVPVYDVVRNMTTFGAPVNRQRESATIPPELQGAAHASPLAQGMAKGLHEYGVMDTSPAAIDHVLLSLFQQQRGFRNAITDNSLGALLDETVKSFHQKEFPGTTKNDYDTVSTELKMQAAREKGGALKTKQYTGLARDFANTDNKLKTLAQKWNKAKTAEEKDRIDKQEDELRMNVLKKYYEATGVVHP